MRNFLLIAFIFFAISGFSADQKAELQEKLAPTLSAQLAKQTILFEWEKSPAAEDVVGYNVRYGNNEENLDKTVFIENETLFHLKKVSTGRVYFFSVSAVDSKGAEGPPSDLVRFVPGFLYKVTKLEKHKAELSILGQPGWTVNVIYKEDGQKWRLWRSITLPTESYILKDQNPKGKKRLYYILPQSKD